MKNLQTLILLFISILSYSQNEEKEMVYLLFDEKNMEKCTIPVEGNDYVNLKKFRKEIEEEFIYFKICNETFSTHKNVADTCAINSLNNIKLVDLDYVLTKYNSENEFKHQVFDKIFIIEKISKNKYVNYEVTWVDEIVMIED